MSKLKRIDPTAIPSMFQSLKVVPMRSVFAARRKRKCCACPVGLLLIALEKRRTFPRGLDFIGALVLRSRYTSSYCQGLAIGWDGHPYKSEGCNAAEDREGRVGHRDGMAAWAACIAAGVATT